MEFKEIAEKVKRAKRVRIWIGDPDQPAVGKWITPSKADDRKLRRESA